MNIEFIVNTLFNSITYILLDEVNHNCWLIDCGDTEKIVEKGYSVKGILLTHSHFDHIYGIPSLVKQFPECQIYTSEWGVKGLASDKLNFSRYHGTPITYVGDNIHVLYEGDTIELFDGVYVEVLETPGHDKSCLTYKVDNNLFTGDSYIPGIKVVTTFPNSNKVDAEVSKERIITMAQGKNICPGHRMSI